MTLFIKHSMLFYMNVCKSLELKLVRIIRVPIKAKRLYCQYIF